MNIDYGTIKQHVWSPAEIFELSFHTYPMLTIHIFICIPFPGEKRPFPADDFSGKERGQSRVFLLGQTQQYINPFSDTNL